MATPLTLDVLDSPAVAILGALERDGFTVQLEPDDTIVIRPLSRLTPEQKQQIVEHKAAVKLLLRCCLDPGVLERRDVMRRQFAAAPAGRLPALLFRPDVPCVLGSCFSCGDELQTFRVRRCWRCALAWRLAARVPIALDLADALDGAKVT
ncbi:MAG: hypothetical protein HY657_17135 [Acidobacteria bacterium]|nr:hypothetical protein [Acidobacteriota bacterium]